MNGVPSLRPTKYASLSKNKKNVSRAYGGSRCACCVRNRYKSVIRLKSLNLFTSIVRAFLVEEQKIVKKVLKTKAAPAEAAAPKKEKKAAPKKK